jgi:hypothetical protein
MILTVKLSYAHFILLFFVGELNVDLGDHHDIQDNMYVLGTALPGFEFLDRCSLNLA